MKHKITQLAQFTRTRFLQYLFNINHYLIKNKYLLKKIELKCTRCKNSEKQLHNTHFLIKKCAN